MTEPSETEDRGRAGLPVDVALYIDSSALVKLYVPETESDKLDAFLARGKGVA